MTAEAVRQIVHRDSSSSSSPPSVSPASRDFDNFTVGAIRRFIHNKFLSDEHFTVGSLNMDLKTAGIIPEDASVTSILPLVQSMGLRYKTVQRKMYVRKESLPVVCRWITALRALRRHREEGRQVVYVDETWFTTRMSHNREWTDTTQAAVSATHSCQVPPGEGERFMVIAAGTEDGFIEDSYLCYATKTTQGDYHGVMNSKLF